jgi:ISXO2-like transposase domain
MRHIADASAECLHPFVKDFIAPGSVVHTDGWRGYAGLDTQGYTHEVTVLKLKGKKAERRSRPRSCFHVCTASCLS